MQFSEELTRGGLHRRLENSCFFMKRASVSSWPHAFPILSAPWLDVMPLVTMGAGGASVKTKDQHNTADEVDRSKDPGSLI